MENKRLLLAVVLSFAVLFGWQFLSEYMGWAPPRETLETVSGEQPVPIPEPGAIPAPDPGSSSALEGMASGLPVFVPTQGRDVVVDTPLYTAVFHSGGGVLKSFVMKHYRQGVEPGSPLQALATESSFAMAPMGLTLNGLPSWNSGDWAFEGEDLTLVGDETGSLSFTGLVDGIRLTRTLTFDAATYLIAETVNLGGPDAARSVRLGFRSGSSSLSDMDSSYDRTRIAWSENGSSDDNSDEKKLFNEGIQRQGILDWGGIMNNYFMGVVAPEDPSNITLKARIIDNFWGVVMEQSDIQVLPGSETTVRAYWWYGAKDRELLDEAPANLSVAAKLGMFSIIARPLLSLLVFFHGFVGNWGVAIILLTCLIRILFFPLSQKSYKSMEKMKKLQPMMQKIREKYGDDREAMNREVMQLYRTYGANPLSGCLPILVQLPVFFGLYQALLNALELRHAPFITYLPFTDIVWLADLSARDPLYISPILMGAAMFLQQKMSPPVGEPLQQKIMLALPIVFTIMFLNFPSGLVVYWFFNNLLSIGQQWVIMRKSSS